MLGDSSFDDLVTKAPVNLQQSSPDWGGVTAALQAEGITPSSVLAVSWCDFSSANIEANIDPTILAVVYPAGILATAGKRKMMGGGIKYSTSHFRDAKPMARLSTSTTEDTGSTASTFAVPEACCWAGWSGTGRARDLETRALRCSRPQRSGTESWK